jgi:integrase
MARSRANGEGSVWEVTKGPSKGKFRATYWATDAATGKRKRLYLPLSATKTEAKRKLANALRHVQDGTPVPDPKLTLDAWMTTWFRDVLTPSKKSGRATFDNYSTLYRKHVRDELGHMKLADLRAEHVAKLLARKLLPKDEGGEGYQVSTVNRVRAILLSALDVAEDWGKIPKNVVRKTDSPGSGNRGNRAMTLEEESKLLAACEGERLGILYLTALGTGLRPGELLGLHWSDVDLDGAKLAVRNVARLEQGKIIVDGKLKTRTSLREVDLPDEVVTALREHRTNQKRDQLAADVWHGPRWKGSELVSDGLVFTTRSGGVLDGSNVRRNFQRVCLLAGINREGERPWHPHELRHTFATDLGEEGGQLEVTSRILGHASVRVTADTYSHPSPARAADAAQRQSDRLARARALVNAHKEGLVDG